jgi:hypothetical protein
MIQRFTGQLPVWARPDHPVLRYELGSVVHPSWKVRYGRALGVIVLGGLLLTAGYFAATQLLRNPAGENPVEVINNVLFWPLLVLQVLLRIVAVTLTSNTVADEIRRQNWDSLRATPFGAELAMRARWATVFYRLRGLLGVVLVARVVLIGGLLWDLTAFQGRHLDLLTTGITPEVALVVAVLLLSFLMTAALLLPLTAVGFDSSIGLLISATVQQRTYSTLLQALYIFFRIAVVVLLVFATTRFLEGQFVVEGQLGVTDLLSWLLVFAFAAMGDWGLAFLHLGRYGEIWATVPYGIFLGLALLIFALAQAALADQLLVFAVRRAQRKG